MSFVSYYLKNGGKHGVYECGHGAVAYPDFLALMASHNSYYQQCTKIKLERQVGSRYFVTAANAGKILFLKDAANSFLKYVGKEKGNKLEQSVFQKLQDPLELTGIGYTPDKLLYAQPYALGCSLG